MSDDLARLRRGCLDAAAGLAARQPDAWVDAGRVAAAIADPAVGVPLTAEHLAAGDDLVRVLLESDRQEVVERLLACARTLASSAHERLETEGRAAAILERLAEGRQRPADPPPRPRRAVWR